MKQHSPVLLVVDDDARIIRIVEGIARRHGVTVVSSTEGQRAIASLGSLHPDVALIDLKLPDADGMDILRSILKTTPHCQALMMSGYATIESAVQAVKLGALDYVTKPFELDRLDQVLTAGLARASQYGAQIETDHDVLGPPLAFCGMVGKSPAMQRVFGQLRRLAPHVHHALIVGETGVGKELIAQAFHALGRRSERPLVTCNCSGIVESLFESELFGHVRGAFTGAVASRAGMFEAAHRGTIFLDEVGELPLSAQAKLLRVVESGEIHRVGSAGDTTWVNVCVLAATNRNLEQEVASGRFRSDLLYRLNVVEIFVPPLRTRPEDIQYLATAFIDQYAMHLNKTITGLTTAAETRLRSWEWPGNVRELRNVIERACIMCDGRFLTEADIAQSMRGSEERRFVGPRTQEVAIAADISRPMVEETIRSADGNKTEAARRLQISRRSLYRILQVPS